MDQQVGQQGQQFTPDSINQVLQKFQGQTLNNSVIGQISQAFQTHLNHPGGTGQNTNQVSTDDTTRRQ